jgi:hypothetical protein
VRRIDCASATDLLRQQMRFFQDHPSILEETKYAVEAAGDSQVFAEFVGALEGKRPEINTRNIDCPGLFVPSLTLRNFCLLGRLSICFVSMQSFRRSTNSAGEFTMLKRKTCKLSAMFVDWTRKLPISAERILALQPKTGHKSKKWTLCTSGTTS